MNWFIIIVQRFYDNTTVQYMDTEYLGVNFLQ